MDQRGVALDILVQDRRNGAAAKRFFKRLPHEDCRDASSSKILTFACCYIRPDTETKTITRMMNSGQKCNMAYMVVSSLSNPETGRGRGCNSSLISHCWAGTLTDGHQG